MDRCVAIASQTSLAILIIHPREEAFRQIEQAAGRPLVWLPGFSTVHLLLDTLHALQAEVATAEAAPGARPTLSAREREVVELVAAGQSNHTIAHRLRISEETVKTHVRHITEKLNVGSRRELIARYRSERDNAEG